jgi:hypothetical protein
MSSITPSAAGDELAELEEETLREEREVERRLVHNIVLGIVFAVPVAIGLCIALMSIALSSDHIDWLAWYGMAAFFGTLAGTFFGVWTGFVRTTSTLDDTDSHAWGSPIPHAH